MKEHVMANRGLTPRDGSREVSTYSRDPFSVFRREMDQLFDEFLTPFTGNRAVAGQGGRSGWPSIDVEETDAAYVVTADVPGMDPKDVELNLRDNMLSISGEKQQERKSEEGGRSWTERSHGRFERTIPFDADIDQEKVEASCRNGVLTVTLPKKPEAQEKSRKIEIKPN
jgi:HSP20 family protein